MKSAFIAIAVAVLFGSSAFPVASREPLAELEKRDTEMFGERSEPREGSAPTKRRAREREGESEGRSPSERHDDYRIIGTIERVDASDIAVKQTKDGKVIAMAWQKTSKVTRDKKPVPRAQLAPGLHVVVDARGDSLLELDVVEVRIVPAPAKK